MNRVFVTLAMLIGMLSMSVAHAQPSPPQSIFSLPGSHCQTPKWSPDGKEVAIELFAPKKDAREIVIVTVSDRNHSVGSQKVNVGRSQAGALLGAKKPPVVELAWAPNRNQLSKPYIFSSLGPRKNFDLFADGSWLTTNVGNDGQPAWSSNGRYIAYVSQQRESGDVYLLDLQGDIEKPIRVTPFSNSTEYRPQWGGQQNRLLFTRSTETGTGQDVGVVGDVTRPKETVKMIVEWSSDEIRPTLSPDGRQVAFYSNRKKKNKKHFDLWIADVDGSNVKKLAKDVVVADVNGPVWLPDGTKLIYVSRDFRRDNPVAWVSKDGVSRGIINTNTQLNSDLDLHASGDRLRLAIASQGVVGSSQKTWQQIFVVEFRASDLK